MKVGRMLQSKVDADAFEIVKAQIDGGGQLTIEHLLDVFGKDAALLFILALLDAGDAARAIQGAMARLSVQSAQEADDDSLEAAQVNHLIIQEGN